ncbi:MAG: hypothetical protein ACOH2R_08575 [Pseudomonas sp.]
MTIDATTDQLFALAQQSLGYASGSAGRINVSSKPVLRETKFSYDVGNLNLQAPPKFSDLFSGTDNAAVNISNVNADVSQWLSTYFPSIDGAFKGVPEDYLINVISGVKPFGMASTIFDMVWHQARDRAGRTVRSEKATLSATFSARGFSIPPGALVDQLAQSERRASDAALDVNREQAIKDADIKNQILQQAVQLATQLKMGIMNTAAELFRAYTAMYQLDSQAGQIKTSAYQSFYNALSSYYGVEVNMEQLRLRAAETKASTDNGIDSNRIRSYSASSTGSAHSNAANAFAAIASSAASAAGTLEAHITSGSS